jgi:hypothetical protein
VLFFPSLPLRLLFSGTGEWLRDQNTMEDTITILQKEGWMA